MSYEQCTVPGCGGYAHKRGVKCNSCEIASLRSRLAEATEVLREVEWLSCDDEPISMCPVCSSYRHREKAKRTHAPDCRLARVLKGDK